MDFLTRDAMRLEIALSIAPLVVAEVKYFLCADLDRLRILNYTYKYHARILN